MKPAKIQRSGSTKVNKSLRLALMACPLLVLTLAGEVIFCGDSARAALNASATAPEALDAARSSRLINLAQDDDDNMSDIPPSALAKYVAIYRDMQRNRGLTVEQAASREGMSLSAFRKLEGQIEKDDAARQQVRDELQAAAKKSAPTVPPSSTH